MVDPHALRAARAVVPLLAVLACKPVTAPVLDDDPRYLCRVDVAPLQAALRAAGGDPTRVLHPSSAAGLLALSSGRRYKFVLTAAGTLTVAPLPADAPHNEYVHPILGDGAAVRSAGGITVIHDDGRVSRVVLDAESRAYCTSAESLRPTVRVLRAMGLAGEAVVVEARPMACVDPARPPPSTADGGAWD